MKTLLFWVICQVYAFTLLVQTPSTFNYQGIARNAQGAPLAGTIIAVRLSIKDAATNGSILYSETKSVTTNAFGLYTILINDGTGSHSGDFNSINWSSGARYLQTEIDPANGTTFIDIGTQQMQSVPHALSAQNLDGIVSPKDGDTVEYSNGVWKRKPKTRRFHITGQWLGVFPYLNFLAPTVTVTIEEDNPRITLAVSKSLGSAAAGGGRSLTINLGYQKAGGNVTAFSLDDEQPGLRVPSGCRIPFAKSGSYQTNFKAGETYTIGLIGFSTEVSSWNDNGDGSGFVEISY
jgi:hypothetical protein